MDRRIIDRAARCATFAEFRRRFPKDYAKLLRLGQAKELYDIYESGLMETMRPPEPRKAPDKRYRENRVTPHILRSQVMKTARLYKTYGGFMKRAGEFSRAAKRLGMEEELQRFFDRKLHTDEILEEAADFPDWDSFEMDRPRYAAEAEAQNIKDYIVKAMEAGRA